MISRRGLIHIMSGFLVLISVASAASYGKIPSFSLITQSGKKVTLADFRGHPWIADFIYTRCTDECPLLSQKIERLQKQLPSGINLVSFSVDPVHDTPAVLTRYARHFSAGPRWFFLTGNPRTIAALAKNGFHIPVIKNRSVILHTNQFVLVDAGGSIRGYYDSESPAELERLAKDVQVLTANRD